MKNETVALIPSEIWTFSSNKNFLGKASKFLPFLRYHTTLLTNQRERYIETSCTMR